MKITILISFLFLTIHHKTAVPVHFVKTDTSRYAIFKLDDNPLAFASNTKPTCLSKQEIEQIEILIKTTAKQYNKRNTVPGQIKHPGRYFKQVIPIINSKGEKEVWINCLCMVDGAPD